MRRSELEIRSLNDMENLASELSKVLKAGDVLALTGELGAGKTALAKLLFSALGLKNAVTSPTYNIINTYETGTLSIVHCDLYRLDSEEELTEIGFEDYFDGAHLLVVEWADKFKDYLLELAPNLYGISISLRGDIRLVYPDERLAALLECVEIKP